MKVKHRLIPSGKPMLIVVAIATVGLVKQACFPGPPPQSLADWGEEQVPAGVVACHEQLPGWQIEWAQYVASRRVQSKWHKGDSTATCLTQFDKVSDVVKTGPKPGRH